MEQGHGEVSDSGTHLGVVDRRSWLPRWESSEPRRMNTRNQQDPMQQEKHDSGRPKPRPVEDKN